MASELSLFLAELKRRKVTRVAVVYALVGLGVIEGASMILPTLQLEAGNDYIVIFVLFGFPIALVLAWALEVTPQGIQKTADLTPEQLASQTPDKWRASSWVLAGVGLAVVLGAGYFVFFRGGGDPILPEEAVAEALPEDYVAVFPFEDRTGGEALADLGSHVAYWITEGLLRAGEVRPVATTTVEAELARGEGRTALEIAAHLKVGLAVTGVYSLRGGVLEFRAEIIRVANWAPVNMVSESGDPKDPEQVVQRLRQKVMGGLAISTEGRPYLEASSPPPYSAYQAYKRGNEIFSHHLYQDALPYLQDAFAQESTFFPAANAIADAFYNEGHWAKLDSLTRVLENRTGEMSRMHRLAVELNRAVPPGVRIIVAWSGGGIGVRSTRRGA